MQLVVKQWQAQIERCQQHHNFKGYSGIFQNIFLCIFFLWIEINPLVGWINHSTYKIALDGIRW
jgi:hypothetical protein